MNNLRDIPNNLRTPQVFQSPLPSPAPSGLNGSKVIGLLLAALMFVYSVLLFLPNGNKSGAGSGSKAVSTTNGKSYSIPNMVFASLYLVMAIFLTYTSFT